MHKSINDINTNIWVSASAGSGKTKVLIDRFITLLIKGVPPQHIICITFTKSAASEMLERINQKLSHWAICSDKTLITELQDITGNTPSELIKGRARTLLAQMLDIQHMLQIKTIHSLCQTILSKFPIEADTEINAQILEGSELEKLQIIAQKYTMSEYQSSAFAKSIDYLLCNVHDMNLPEVFAQQMFIVAQTPDFFSSPKILKSYVQNLYQKLTLPIDFNIETKHQKVINKIISITEEEIAQTYNHLPIINTLLQFKGHDDLTLLSSFFFTSLGEPKKRLLNKKDAPEDLIETLKKIQNILVQFEHQKIALKTIRQTEGFLFLGHVFIDVYKKIKKQKQRLDYNDLLHHTIKLLDNDDVTQWVQYKLHHKIEHLLVDEAQDTNLLQWKIIYQLQKIFFQKNNDKKYSTFVVGDPKQSIYSFQGTSPEIFEGMKHLNVNANQNWQEHQLTTSYRSDQIILNFVDEVFNSITKSSPNLFYTTNLKHNAAVSFDHSSVEILPAILGEKTHNNDNAWEALEDYPDHTYEPSQILAEILAKKVHELIEKKIHQPSDFLILIRKRDKLAYNIIKAFKKLRIPISGIDRIHLNTSLAIQDLMSVANFILLPQDDYNTACLLKSPICNASESEIANLTQHKTKSLWHNLEILHTENKTYKHYYDTLKNFSEITAKHSPFDLFIHILDVLSYRKDFIKCFDQQINEVLDEFLNICQVFQNNDKSLVNFVHWFNNSNLEIKRDVFASKNEIRMMTVHASKGLQAKYVILPDTVNVPTNKNPIIWEQSDNIFIYKTDPIQNISEYCQNLIDQNNIETLQEYYRLLYVALTRSKQHLLICGWSNKQSINDNSWFSRINKVMQEKESKHAPTIMGYHNIDHNEEHTTKKEKFFFSNSDNIFYVEKKPRQKNEILRSLGNKKNITIPAFVNVTLKPKQDTLKFSPSNLTEDSQKIDANAKLGTILHKALELFVHPNGTNNKALGTYLKNNIPNKDSDKFYTNTLNNIIQSVLLPQIRNSLIKKEIKIYKQYSRKINLSAKIDLLIINKKDITIIDYKTKIKDEISEPIYEQLALYADAIADIYPEKNITCKVISILTQKEFVLKQYTIKKTLEKLNAKFAALV